MFCMLTLSCILSYLQHLQPGLKRGNWRAEEDQTILKLRQEGMAWGAIAEHLPGRIGEQVRDRYLNSLDPELNKKKTPWTEEETRVLYHYQSIHGNKWTEIAKHLPGRSEAMVRNRWHNTEMAKIRRQRRLEAPKNYVAEINDNDVVSQPGVFGREHPGNIKYLKMIMMNISEYKSSSKANKTRISQTIIDYIHEVQKGRFLEFDAVAQMWYEVDNVRARTKTSQCLRDPKSPEARAKKRAKYGC